MGDKRQRPFTLADGVSAVYHFAWMDGARCRDEPVGMFYEGRSQDRLAVAQRVCSDCKVRYKCAVHGLDEAFGIWGGLFRHERAQFAQDRAMVESQSDERALLDWMIGCTHRRLLPKYNSQKKRELESRE